MRKITPFNAVCITLLWLFLCFILVKNSNGITLKGAFAIIVSGIIIFVPLYKKYKRGK